MNVNFEIVENYALNFEGKHIDLHNNFDFADFDYNVVDREISLMWKMSSGEWVDKNEPSSLVLTHKAVTFLKVVDQVEKGHNEDHGCLGEITFYPSTERELNESIMVQSKPNDGDDILYLFESGKRIRIHCEQIELTVNFNQYLNLKVSKDEALVLFEFLERFNQSRHPEIFEDQAEQKTLWILEGQLEKQLVEPFSRDYEDIIKAARKKIRDEE